jgi:hypothetical protein
MTINRKSKSDQIGCFSRVVLQATAATILSCISPRKKASG